MTALLNRIGTLISANVKRVGAAVLIIAFVVNLFTGVQTANANSPVQVAVDAGIVYQTIDNFGASDAWSMDPIGKNWSEESKTIVADLLFSQTEGIGLSAWRFNIGAGSAGDTGINNPWRRAECFLQEDGTYDWTKQAGQQWFLHAAAERGVESFTAFSNSPPVSMTKNGRAFHTDYADTTNLKDGYEDDFAGFLVDVVEHFRDEGINIDDVSPINEPVWEWVYPNQEGCRYSVDDAKRVIRALWEELGDRDLQSVVKISAPEAPEYRSMWDDETHMSYPHPEFFGKVYNEGINKYNLDGKYREYIQEFLGDEEIRGMIDNKFVGHGYWSEYDDRQTLYRTTTRDEIRKYSPDAKFWMTELCLWQSGRDYGINAALQIARNIHNDLTKLDASAWQWWTAVSEANWKDGLIYTDSQRRDAYLSENIYTTKSLWALGNYSRFIRPGAKRVELVGADDHMGLMGSAYLNEDRNQIVVVYVNYGHADEDVHMSFSNLPDGKMLHSLTPYVTSSTDELAEKASIPADSTYTIPQRSVVTFVGTYEYAFSGFLSPVDMDGENEFKSNRTIPLKFRLQDVNGEFVPDADVRMYLAQVVDGIVGAETEIASTGAEARENLIRYDAADNQYIYTFSTRGLGAGIYRIRLDIEGSSHTLVIRLR